MKPSRRLLFQLAECLDSKNVTALAAILSKQSSYTGSLEVDLSFVFLKYEQENIFRIYLLLHKLN